MEVLFVIIPLALFIGSVLGLVSFIKIKDLNVRLHNIEGKLDGIKQQADSSTTSDQEEFISPVADVAAETLPVQQAKSDWINEPVAQDQSAITYPEEVATEHNSVAAARPAIDWGLPGIMYRRFKRSTWQARADRMAAQCISSPAGTHDSGIYPLHVIRRRYIC
jgi:hypothetical protein